MYKIKFLNKDELRKIKKQMAQRDIHGLFYLSVYRDIYPGKGPRTHLA